LSARPIEYPEELRTLDPPAAKERQIAIRSTALSSSDLNYYHHYRHGDKLVREPLILGHESAGIVVSVGSNVTAFKVGEKVALEVGQPCGECDRCREGSIISAKACGFAARREASLTTRGRCRRGSIIQQHGATSQSSLLHSSPRFSGLSMLIALMHNQTSYRSLVGSGSYSRTTQCGHPRRTTISGRSQEYYHGIRRW